MKLITIILSLFILTGCSQEIEVNDEQGAKEALQVVENNINALNDKNLDFYLETIDENAHDETREATEELFEMYEIDIELLKKIVIEENTDKFVIQTEQRASSESKEYLDHVSTNLHTVEKMDSEWRISKSEILDISFEE